MPTSYVSLEFTMHTIIKNRKGYLAVFDYQAYTFLLNSQLSKR